MARTPAKLAPSNCPIADNDRETLNSIAVSLATIADCFSSTRNFVAKWVPVIAVAFAVFYPTLSKMITETAQNMGVLQ